MDFSQYRWQFYAFFELYCQREGLTSHLLLFNLSQKHHQTVPKKFLAIQNRSKKPKNHVTDSIVFFIPLKINRKHLTSKVVLIINRVNPQSMSSKLQTNRGAQNDHKSILSSALISDCIGSCNTQYSRSINSTQTR